MYVSGYVSMVTWAGKAAQLHLLKLAGRSAHRPDPVRMLYVMDAQERLLSVSSSIMEKTPNQQDRNRARRSSFWKVIPRTQFKSLSSTRREEFHFYHCFLDLSGGHLLLAWY